MAVIVYLIGLYISNPFLAASIQIPVGASIYFAISHLTKNESYLYSKEMIIKRFQKGR
jgi:hypothetical protein